MPPSGMLPGIGSGFESRYNHMAISMADYCHPYKIRKTSTSGGKRMKTQQQAATTVSQGAAQTPIANMAASAANPALKKCSCPGCQAPKKIDPSVGDGGPPKVRNPGASELSKPLYVDCSVEYELPMVPKIPSDGQPLLVIHPGWQQKRRITRSSSQQRLQMEAQHRMALQQQYQMYCSQCPPMPAPPIAAPPPAMPHPVSTATSVNPSSSRKRSYDSRSASNGGMIPYTGYNEASQNRSKRARTDPSTSWLIQCQEQNCIQQQQHFMMQQQQQHWLRQNWQQQQGASAPLPLPAPPPPVSGHQHPTGFYMHHGSQYHQWHPAYFCPPSAVQMRQQQWLQQQQFQQQQQHQMVNNNLPFSNFKSGPCCPKCYEGKCPLNPPPPGPPVVRNQVAPNTTSVRYRSV